MRPISGNWTKGEAECQVQFDAIKQASDDPYYAFASLPPTP